MVAQLSAQTLREIRVGRLIRWTASLNDERPPVLKAESQLVRLCVQKIQDPKV
jgi:hypothetical protein